MRISIGLLLSTILLASCNNSSEKATADLASNEVQTTAEKIAMAYGIENWKGVDMLEFTFNVDRGERHFERSFKWFPKQNKVVYMNEKDTVSYFRDQPLDSISRAADKRFINDTYWMLSPFKLVWDEGTTFIDSTRVAAAVSKDTLNKLTIIYGNEGGYTPGDAYDFYYDNSYMVKEWAYRPQNAAKAATATLWGEVKSYDGIKIATQHTDTTGNFRLYFSNISVIRE